MTGFFSRISLKCVHVGAVALLLSVAAAGCSPDEVTLVDDGVAKCRIVVEEGTPPSAAFGAKEIAKYFQKVSGAKVEVEEGLGQRSRSTVDGLIPIRITINPQLPPESFEIAVAPSEVTIRGADARGVLYGCYEILKRWAGMRWLVPGDENEYCVLSGRTVRIPCGRYAHAPDIRYRTYDASTDEDFLWCARNNMQVILSWKNFSTDDATPRNRHLMELAIDGRGRSGHCLTRLLCHDTEEPKELFKVHPEYFCLVKGKRTMSTLNCWGPNPCTSNPAVLDRMAETVLANLGHPHANDAPTVIIGNDDSMQWCECDACRALDPPETAKDNYGRRSDRYWRMINEIARRVWAQRPDAKLGGWAYQDFWKPPVREKPDPRLALMISFNNQCWRHSMDDPDCGYNRDLAALYRAWRPFGMRLVINRNEFQCEGCPGATFAPAERILVRNFREAERLGCFGHEFWARGPVPDPLPWEAAHPEQYPRYHGRNLRWWATWQAMYVAARQMWDRSRDAEAEVEEANRLLYGSAWEGGMKDFRATLTEAFYATSGCQRWAISATIAHCLDVPGAERKLKASLARALEVAARDPDPRVLKNVRRVETIFRDTWLCEYERELKTYREYEFFSLTNGRNRAVPVTLAPDTYLKGAYDVTTLALRVWSEKPLEITVRRPGLKPCAKTIVAGGRDVTIAASELGGPFRDGTTLVLDTCGRKRTFVLRPKARADSMTERGWPVWQYGAMDCVDAKTGGPIGWDNPKNAAKSVLHEGSRDDYFTRLGRDAAEVGNRYHLPKVHAGAYRVTCRARGKGTFQIWCASYHHVGGIGGYAAIVNGSAKGEWQPLTDEWQTHSLVTESVGEKDEHISIRFFRKGESELELDDVYVEPL